LWRATTAANTADDCSDRSAVVIDAAPHYRRPPTAQMVGVTFSMGHVAELEYADVLSWLAARDALSKSSSADGARHPPRRRHRSSSKGRDAVDSATTSESRRRSRLRKTNSEPLDVSLDEMIHAQCSPRHVKQIQYANHRLRPIPRRSLLDSYQFDKYDEPSATGAQRRQSTERKARRKTTALFQYSHGERALDPRAMTVCRRLLVDSLVRLPDDRHRGVEGRRADNRLAHPATARRPLAFVSPRRVTSACSLGDGRVEQLVDVGRHVGRHAHALRALGDDAEHRRHAEHDHRHGGRADGRPTHR